MKYDFTDVIKRMNILKHDQRYIMLKITMAVVTHEDLRFAREADMDAR